MQMAVRSYLTAGVALVGASAIAVSSVAPPLPDAKIPAIAHADAAVALTAVANPWVALTDLVGNTAGNIGGLLDQLGASPFPILEQLATNQLANAALIAETAQQMAELIGQIPGEAISTLRAVAENVAAGNIVEAGADLEMLLLLAGIPLIGLISAPLQIAQTTTANIANVFEQLPNQVFPVLLSVLGPVFATMRAVSDSGQAIVDSLEVGDFEVAIGTALSLPIAAVDAFLNGFGDPDDFSFAQGLLTPQINPFTAGPIGALLTLRDAIASWINPAASTTTNSLAADPVAVDQTPDPGAQTLMVSVTTDEEGAAQTPADEPDTAEDTETSEESEEAPTTTERSTRGTVKASPKAVPGETGVESDTKEPGKSEPRKTSRGTASAASAAKSESSERSSDSSESVDSDNDD